jgi:hypothetical protein
MDWNREEDIRKRALRIWEEEGKPDGKDAQHWSQAERELDIASGQGGQAGPTEAPTGGGNPNRR